MICDLHEMLFCSPHALMLSWCYKLSLPMTWLHLSYSVYIIRILYAMLLLQDRMICYDGTSSIHKLFLQEQTCYNDDTTFLYNIATISSMHMLFFPGINMLDEWFDFTIWYEHMFFPETYIEFNHENLGIKWKSVHQRGFVPQCIWTEVQCSCVTVLQSVLLCTKFSIRVLGQKWWKTGERESRYLILWG